MKRDIFIKNIILLSVALVVIQSCRPSAGVLDHAIENHLIPKVVDTRMPSYHSIDTALTMYDIPSLSIAIIEGGELTHDKVYSQMEALQSQYIMGSISKPVTALITLMLTETTELDLDTDINKYLKRWQLPDSPYTIDTKITLRHLLSHTAGINNWNGKGFDVDEPLPDLIEILDGESKSPAASIDTIPGSHYYYSNLGYGIVQMVIEDFAERTFTRLADSLIFRPLGMYQSTFDQREASTSLALGHDRSGDVLHGGYRRTALLASGGLRSTSADLSRLLLALQDAINHKADSHISHSIADLIISDSGYHLGFEISGTDDDLSVTHTGRVPGYFAYMRLYPRQHRGFVISCNSDNGASILTDALRGLSDLYDWDIMSPKTITTIDVPTEVLQNYVGDYELSYEGDVYHLKVSLLNKELVMQPSDDDTIYPLRPTGHHTFVDMIDGDIIVFSESDGTIVSLTTNGEYTYERVDR